MSKWRIIMERRPGEVVLFKCPTSALECWAALHVSNTTDSGAMPTVKFAQQPSDSEFAVRSLETGFQRNKEVCSAFLVRT